MDPLKNKSDLGTLVLITSLKGIQYSISYKGAPRSLFRERTILLYTRIF